MSKQLRPNINSLAKILREMYRNAPPRNSVAMIHLFAIAHAKQINELEQSATKLAIAAGIPKSYGTEIRKGVRLAHYVSIGPAGKKMLPR